MFHGLPMNKVCYQRVCDECVCFERVCYHSSGVTDRDERGRALPGKLNAKSGSPLAYILIFSIILVFSGLFFAFFVIFSFF